MCSFSLVNWDIEENSVVNIWDTIINLVKINAWDNFLYADNIFDLENKYPVWSKIVLGIKSNMEEVEILLVDPVLQKLTFTTNVVNSYEPITQHGKRFFSWVVTNKNQTMISKDTNDVQYNYDLVELSKILDRKVVIWVYDTAFVREIMARIVYEFVANDSQKDFFDFWSTLTWWGVGSTTSNYSTDKIQGAYSQKATTTGAGTATRTKTITSVDLTWLTDFRYRWKVKLWEGQKISSFKIRFWQNSSNYFEYTNTHTWNDWEDLRLYESFKIAKYISKVWSPTLTWVVWLQYEVICSSAIDFVLFDYAFVTTGGITMTNCKKWTQKFDQVRFKWKSPSVCFESLTKSLEHFWYVDYEWDLHYYYSDWESDSSFQLYTGLTATDRNYSRLEIKVDTNQIVNRQLVEWNEAPTESLYTQKRSADGKQTSFNLDYKPAWQLLQNWVEIKQWLKVFVGWVEKTVGVEWLVDSSLYDFTFNFNEKVVNNAAYPLLTAGTEIKFTYYPYKIISVRYADVPSINAMKLLVWWDGIFDWQIIIDKTIDTIQTARQRATIEVSMRKNPLVSYTFKTDINGIQLGQMIYVNDTARWVSQKFQVQKISTKSRAGNLFSYQVEITTRFFDYVEFFQLLLKKSSNLNITENADVIIPINDDEDITIQDLYSLNIQTTPYHAGSKLNKFYFFNLESWTSTYNSYIWLNPWNMWYFLTSLASDWQGRFVSDSWFSTWKVLELINTYSTSWKYSLVNQVKSDISSSRSFTFRFRLKVLSIGAWSWTIKVYINEYDSWWSILATQTITILNVVSDYNLQTVTFTTNSSTVKYDIQIKILELVATVRLWWYQIIDNSVETATNVGYASFSSAS